MNIFSCTDIYCQIAFQKGGGNLHSDTMYGHECLFRCTLTSIQQNLKTFVAHLKAKKESLPCFNAMPLGFIKRNETKQLVRKITLAFAAKFC